MRPIAIWSQGPEASWQNGTKEAAASCRDLQEKASRPLGAGWGQTGGLSPGLIWWRQELWTPTQGWCLPLLMKATRCILEGDLGKCARRRPADADLSPSRSAAGVPASPPLHSWLSVSGSEVLLGEAGLDPNLLSTLQIS